MGLGVHPFDELCLDSFDPSWPVIVDDILTATKFDHPDVVTNIVFSCGVSTDMAKSSQLQNIAAPETAARQDLKP